MAIENLTKHLILALLMFYYRLLAIYSQRYKGYWGLCFLSFFLSLSRIWDTSPPGYNNPKEENSKDTFTNETSHTLRQGMSHALNQFSVQGK